MVQTGHPYATSLVNGSNGAGSKISCTSSKPHAGHSIQSMSSMLFLPSCADAAPKGPGGGAGAGVPGAGIGADASHPCVQELAADAGFGFWEALVEPASDVACGDAASFVVGGCAGDGDVQADTDADSSH